MDTNTISNSKSFSLTYNFFDDTHETELSMMIGENNILAFKRGNSILTTRWNLDELVLWLRGFIDTMAEDPYPVEADGEYAAIKDINARDFDSEDEDEFDAYYDRLDDWNLRHRWHPASCGAVLADLYFQLVGNEVEISWNNEDTEEDVEFLNTVGGTKVKKEVFYNVVDAFLKAYALHWFN